MTWDIGLQVRDLYGGYDVSTTELTFTPVPIATLLGIIGLAFSSWLLKRKRMI